MLLTISHTTSYSYDAPVHYALQRLRLQPPDNRMQHVVEWHLDIEGGTREASYRDQHGNHTLLVSMLPDTSSLAITARGTVETTDTAGVLGFIKSPVPLWHYRQDTPLTMPGEGVKALAEGLEPGAGLLDGLHALMARVAEKVAYAPGTTYAATAAEDAVQGGTGVCQDHAHIFIAAARSAGVPARYVSGYLRLDETDDQEAGHAWAEAWLPDLGWVGFDISNVQCPDDRYVRLASGLDYREAAPLTGLRRGFGNESMIVTLQVQQ